MNICLVSQQYPPETAKGGIGTQTWNKAHALAELGHSVHVISCASSKRTDIQTTNSPPGVTVHRISAPTLEFPIYTQPAYWVGYSWAVLRRLNCLIPDATLDIIDFAEYGAEGFAYQLDRTPWNWVPVVVQLHGPLAMFAKRVGWPDQDGEFYRVGMFMEGLSITQADAVMACSANIADFTADLYNLPRESIDVVHCGVDSESFRPLDPKERQNDSRPIVLFVGNIAANKGVTTVFDAALMLRSKYPEIKLQILGTGDDELLRRLKSRAESSGAAANVEFTGFVNRDRLPEFYRRASVFCSPAQHEVGVANVYIEAMACGCPVVCSTTGAAPEAITDSETGLLVPPNDVEATAAALDRILDDGSFRRRLASAGRRHVDDYFAMDKYISRILAIYRKAIINSLHKLERASVSK